MVTVKRFRFDRGDGGAVVQSSHAKGADVQFVTGFVLVTDIVGRTLALYPSEDIVKIVVDPDDMGG